MLCAEVTHKILRTDTVYDFLNDLYQTSRSFTNDAIKALVGEIVLTRYAVRVGIVDRKLLDCITVCIYSNTTSNLDQYMCSYPEKVVSHYISVGYFNPCNAMLH